LKILPRGGLVDVAEKLHGEVLREQDEMSVVLPGAVNEELHLLREVVKTGDGAEQVLNGGNAHAARAGSAAHGLGGGLFECRVLLGRLQAY
jgi:hypothetical protein